MVRKLIQLTVALATVAAGFAVAVGPGAQPAVAVSAPLVVIFMENKERSTIEGSADADYLKSFEAGGRSFTHYYGVTHPSLPNYLAFASGSTEGKTGTDNITAGEISDSNIWGQLEGAGVSWGVYEEDMPSSCYGGVTSGGYALKHNPAIPYNNIWTKPARCAKVVPFSSFDVNNLKAVSFIAPNLTDDMHDGTIAQGDNWLAAHVPAMITAGAEVVITFDEGSTSTNGGGNVYTAVEGPGINAGNTRTGTFNHYNLLAAIEDREAVVRLNSAVGVTALPI